MFCFFFSKNKGTNIPQLKKKHILGFAPIAETIRFYRDKLFLPTGRRWILISISLRLQRENCGHLFQNSQN